MQQAALRAVFVTLYFAAAAVAVAATATVQGAPCCLKAITSAIRAAASPCTADTSVECVLRHQGALPPTSREPLGETSSLLLT